VVIEKKNRLTSLTHGNLRHSLTLNTAASQFALVHVVRLAPGRVFKVFERTRSANRWIGNEPLLTDAKRAVTRDCGTALREAHEFVMQWTPSVILPVAAGLPR
jgi:hypothetical protein